MLSWATYSFKGGFAECAHPGIASLDVFYGAAITKVCMPHTSHCGPRRVISARTASEFSFPSSSSNGMVEISR